MAVGVGPSITDMSKSVYLKTYGCQMNERDSEEILGMLSAQGYERAAEPEEADVILFNTCSVREHAEDRAIGTMGKLQELKIERPGLILGILGCMAKVQREDIFRRLPYVDLVAGPAELYDLPMLLAEVESKQRLGQGPDNRPLSAARRIAVDRPYRPLDQKPPGDYRHNDLSAFVTIMEGCDKRCSYCVVPLTRGQEVSRPADEVLEEIRQLVRSGCREVTLLGQNVNSYGKRFPDGAGYQGPRRRAELVSAMALATDDESTGALTDFPVLLQRIDVETGVDRIRFTTSHPFDAHERLFEVMAECESVCEHLHLPVQSGSDTLLRAMRRGYTSESYRQQVARLRALVPGVALSTDIIVGFPGETEEDFAATLGLIEDIQFDSAFIFQYSQRPETEAATLTDTVSAQTISSRLQAVLALQTSVTKRRLEQWIGRRAEVLVEGPSRHGRGQLQGRLRTRHRVVFEGASSLRGSFVDIEIQAVEHETLLGRLVS